MAVPTETFNQRRLYSTLPYLNIVDKPFKIHIESLLPELKVFIIQRKNEWGDTWGTCQNPEPYNLTGYTIQFRLFDASNTQVMQGLADVSDATVGEVKYEWKEFDLQKVGVHRGEFIFTKSGKSFVLPSPENRLQIVVFK